VEAVEAGPAATAGVQAGDILLKLGSDPIESAAGLRALAANMPVDQPVPLLLRRQDNAAFVTLTLPKALPTPPNKAE
jgi:serine protease Do